MTPRDFAKREGFTVPQVLDLLARGLITDAQQNPFSKKWHLGESAELVGWLQDLCAPEASEDAACDSQGAALPSSAGAMPASGGHAGPHPSPLGLAGLCASLADWQAPQGRAVGLAVEESRDDSALRASGSEHQAEIASASLVEASPFRSVEVQSMGLALRRAVARQCRKSHRLQLDSVELVHLFHAVEIARKKARQAAAKGLQGVGALRATDSLWQKLQQAMQHVQGQVARLGEKQTHRNAKRQRLEWVPE